MEKPRIIRQALSSWTVPALYKNVGVYCRVSSCIRPQLDSLATQVSYYVQMFSRRHDCKLVDIYIDVSSGERTENRYQYLRMMDDAKAGKLDIIITKSISRFGRNTEDLLAAVRILRECNVQVIFEEENIDTLRDSGELIISIISAIAQADNESRRQNQMLAIQRRAQNGTSELYSRRCYGYRKTKSGGLEINHAEAAVVQLIFQSYLDGASVIGIQRILKDKGIQTSRGNEQWSKIAIDHILSNEKYTGSVIIMKTETSPEKGHKRQTNLRNEKYLISDIHPAIISKEMYDAVQEERKRRSNTVTDETGTHRKSTKYSSKKLEGADSPNEKCKDCAEQ